MSLAVGPLRECLADCQLNRGLPPELCQDECGALTPGDTCVEGCCSFWSCFIQDLPSSAANAAAGIGGVVGEVTAPLQGPLLLVAVIVVGGLVLLALAR